MTCYYKKTVIQRIKTLTVVKQQMSGVTRWNIKTIKKIALISTKPAEIDHNTSFPARVVNTEYLY